MNLTTRANSIIDNLDRKPAATAVAEDTNSLFTGASVPVSNPKEEKVIVEAGDDHIELSQPVRGGVYKVGHSLLHIVKCTTEWNQTSISADNCAVCMVERKAIINDIIGRVHKRLGKTTPQQEEKTNAFLTRDKPIRVADEEKPNLTDETANVNPAPIIVAKLSVPHDVNKEEKTLLAKASTPTKPGYRLRMLSRVQITTKSSLKGTASRQVAKNSLDIPKTRSQGPERRRRVRKALASVTSLDGTLGTDSAKTLLVSGMSRESINMKFTYDEWERIKDETLAALYDASPDIDKLYSLYLQLRRVRMSSAEMSSTCNEAQALLDSTVAQLYQSMTEPCRENLNLNKMQDTDMGTLNALLVAMLALRQQLQQFNIYDRDGILKLSEAKVKERIRKCIAIATRTKNKDLLTDLIIVLKNEPSLKCNDLMETARRTVQSINYDNFVYKHTNRLQKRDVPKAKTGKEMERLRGDLQKIVKEINGMDGKVFDELDVKVVTKLIDSLEQNLKRSSKTTSFHTHHALELYFKIVRGVIRRTVVVQSGSDDISKLRKILKNKGKSLPFRLKTLEICQAIDTLQSARVALERSQKRKDKRGTAEQITILQDTFEQLMSLLKEEGVAKIVPDRLTETLKAEANKLPAKEV